MSETQERTSQLAKSQEQEENHNAQNGRYIPVDIYPSVDIYQWGHENYQRNQPARARGQRVDNRELKMPSTKTVVYQGSKIETQEKR
jgi:hypothetical protein